ncbi:unnamed protein product [Danaus chrysippus]|uniref:(African queen) hypothetical protein n=1 Tax=Danaus chrysippus TaxID=151541 RepID=A0A8J2MWG9_9NEOP|nr:unnamed protein product [Danaus chrysippus]
MSKKHLHNQAAIPLAPAVFKLSCSKLRATFECKAVHCRGDRRRLTRRSPDEIIHWKFPLAPSTPPLRPPHLAPPASHTHTHTHARIHTSSPPPRLPVDTDYTLKDSTKQAPAPDAALAYYIHFMELYCIKHYLILQV